MSYIFPGIPQNYIVNEMIKDGEIESAKIVSLAGSKLTGNAPANFVTNAGIVDMAESKLTGVTFKKEVTMPIIYVDEAVYETDGLTSFLLAFVFKIYVPPLATYMYMSMNTKIAGGTGGEVKFNLDTINSTTYPFTNTSYAWSGNSVYADVSTVRSTYQGVAVYIRSTAAGAGYHAFLNGLTCYMA